MWPVRSHYFPFLPIAQALRDRGHEVAFYTGPQAQPILEEQGFATFPFVEVDADWVEDAFIKGNGSTDWREMSRFRRFMIDWLVGTVPGQVKDLEDIVERWRPDVLVPETSMWGPMLVLHEKLPIPVAVFSTVIACLLPGPSIPPYGLGLPLPKTRRARTLLRMIEGARDVLAGTFRKRANAIRAGHGLPPISQTVTEYVGTMPLYLVPSVPEFDYERTDLPSSVHYIGTCVWNQWQQDEELPVWLTELSSDRPVVHVTEGTLRTETPFVLQAAADGLADLPMQVIMTGGGHRDLEELGLGTLAANIRLESYVPHRDLLPRTDVVVTTGGAGTVGAALALGVPLIVVPTVTDQPENARRVHEAGAGLFLRPSHCTAAGLRAAVEQVLSEPSFKENARRLAAAFARYQGPARAADLLESLAGAPSVNSDESG